MTKMKSSTVTMIDRHSLLPLLLAAMFLLTGFAGCVKDNSSLDIAAWDMENDIDPTAGENGTHVGGDESGQGQSPQWPPLESAPIRPGARLPNCTANFVFWDPVNDTVFMGTAAHCVEHLRMGDNVTIVEGGFPMACVYMCNGTEGASVEGSVAYSGWWTGSDHQRDHGQDFALVEIYEDDRDNVHPKVLHYGGPTGMASSSDVEFWDRVLWYGHSSGRQSYDPIQPNEAYVCGLGNEFDDNWEFTGGGPVIQGDSGSPVLVAKNGMALGVLTTLFPVGCVAPSGGGSWLYKALDEANSRGMGVELATWPLEDDGKLPDLPV